ncbi:MAG: MFS transporter, partial [Anaerolineae bacterium]|nr:MFS transporter [Anaerolineae bacterium]
GMVVLLQLWITSKVKHISPLKIMAAGAVCYALGVGMLGLIKIFPLLVTAVVIITIGELVISPIGQAITVNFSPEDMRGRYLAALTMSWLVPRAVGPYLAGLVMDNISPRWVWYLGGMAAAAAAGGFILLHRAVSHRFESQTLPILD